MYLALGREKYCFWLGLRLTLGRFGLRAGRWSRPFLFFASGTLFLRGHSRGAFFVRLLVCPFRFALEISFDFICFAFFDLLLGLASSAFLFCSALFWYIVRVFNDFGTPANPFSLFWVSLRKNFLREPPFEAFRLCPSAFSWRLTLSESSFDRRLLW